MEKIKKSKTFRTAAFALFSILTVSGQSATVEPADGEGASFANAIPVPSTGVVVAGTYDGRNEVFFKFNAEVEGDYYLQESKRTVGYDYTTFRLFNKKQKEIEYNSGRLGCFRMPAGGHVFSIKPRNEAKDYSIVVSMHVPYDAKPVEGKSKQFAAAKPMPLFDTIRVNVNKEGEETCFVLEILENGRYQIHNKTKSIISYYLYNDKYVRIRSGNNFEEGLLAGKYYLIVNSDKTKAGDFYSFMVTQEGKTGYEGTNIILAEKIKKAMKARMMQWAWVRSNPLGMSARTVADFLAIIGVLLLGIIVYKLTFQPYARYIANAYEYSVFGWHTWIMLVLLLALIFLPIFGFDPLGLAIDGVVFADTRGQLILLSIFSVYFVITSIVLYIKSRKIDLIPVNIIVVTAFFALAWQFVMFAVLFVLVIIAGIVMLSMASGAMQYNAANRATELKGIDLKKKRGY